VKWTSLRLDFDCRSTERSRRSQAAVAVTADAAAATAGDSAFPTHRLPAVSATQRRNVSRCRVRKLLLLINQHDLGIA
jgi:hypothetical protein